MIKRLITLLSIIFVFLLGGIIIAQEEIPDDDIQTTPQPTTFTAIVDVESAYIRAVPSFDAEVIASAFKDDELLVVSRNLDGFWFEVRRPGRMTNLGWMFENVLEWDFAVDQLPLGDNRTGSEGPTQLAGFPPFAAFMEEGAALRTAPSIDASRTIDVPPLVTIPLLERNQNGTWFRVHYLGYEGWVIGFTVQTVPDVMVIPQAANLPPLEGIEILIIPPEIQIAELNRLRDFVNLHRQLARDLELFWWAVFRGEVMPCDPPPSVTNYPYTNQDIRELPELQRYAPRLSTAIDFINNSLDPLNYCGVVAPDRVSEARNSAINAKVIFDATLQQLQNLEENVID